MRSMKPWKHLKGRARKRFLACLLSLSVIPMNGFTVMAATEQQDNQPATQVEEQTALTTEDTAVTEETKATTAIDKTTEESTVKTQEENTTQTIKQEKAAVQADTKSAGNTVSFAKDSTTVKIGKFQMFEFEGVDSRDIDSMSFQSSNPSVVDIEQVHTHNEDDDCMEVYVPVAKSTGSATISGTIEMEDGTTKTVEAAQFTAVTADDGIVPVTSYQVYESLRDDDDDHVDVNDDGQISYTEMNKVQEITLEGVGVTDDDISCLQYAKNCAYINLEDNEKITDISFTKQMSKLKKLYVFGTGVKDISVLDNDNIKATLTAISLPGDVPVSQRVKLINNQSINIHAGNKKKNPIRPSGLFETANNVEFEADNDKISVSYEDENLIIETADGVTEGSANLIIKDTESNTELARIPVIISEGSNNEDYGFVNSQQTVNIGCFGKIELKNADTEDVEITSENSDVLEVVEDDDGYHYEPRQTGSAVIEAEITTDDGETYTSQQTVEVLPAKEGIVPLTKYKMYRWMYDYNDADEDESTRADINGDYQISYDEFGKATEIGWSGLDLTNSDIEILKYATSCEVLYLYDNPDITNIDVLRNMTKLQEIDLEETGVTDISVLRGVKDQLTYLWAPDELNVQSRFEFMKDVVYVSASSEYGVNSVIKPSHIMAGKSYEVKSADSNILEIREDEDDYREIIVKDGQEGKVVNLEITCEGQTKVIQVAITDEDGNLPVESIAMNKTSLAMYPGQSEQLSVFYLPNAAMNRTVTWTSSNNAVASVDANGKVTANAAGMAVITAATSNGKIAQCTVTVTNPPAPQPTKPQVVKVNKISVKGISTNIAAGKKVKLTADISPSNAANKSVTWTTSNKKVATVNASGVVSVNKKAGGKTVIITATAKDGSGKKATYKIKVMKGVVKKVKISGKKSVKAGKTLSLKAKVTASKGANKKLIWTSSNTKYATVSASGKVKAAKTAKKKSVKITAMATDGSGKKTTVTIKIK